MESNSNSEEFESISIDASEESTDIPEVEGLAAQDGKKSVPQGHRLYAAFARKGEDPKRPLRDRAGEYIPPNSGFRANRNEDLISRLRLRGV
jgi:hypothetical protein